MLNFSGPEDGSVVILEYIIKGRYYISLIMRRLDGMLTVVEFVQTIFIALDYIFRL